MNIDFNKIKTECPKAFDMFKRYKYDWHNLCQQLIECCNCDFSVWEQEFKLNICFCDITDFFDSQGIIIEIGYRQRQKDFLYRLYFNKKEWYFKIGDLKRPEAQTEATYRAFDILEERLK